MEGLISKNDKILVASENPLFAARCNVTATEGEKGFRVRVISGNLPEFGSCDVFASVKNGLLFFTTEISEKNADEVKFDGFKDVEPLQRREFSRIYSGKNILIEGNDGGIIRAKIINISAGGMKIETNKKIDIGHDLNVNFSLDKNTSVKCQFTPLSQSSDEESPDKFIVSGKFTNMKPSDVIILCRYCTTQILKQKSIAFDERDD